MKETANRNEVQYTNVPKVSTVIYFHWYLQIVQSSLSNILIRDFKLFVKYTCIRYLKRKPNLFWSAHSMSFWAHYSCCYHFLSFLKNKMSLKLLLRNKQFKKMIEYFTFRFFTNVSYTSPPRSNFHFLHELVQWLLILCTF